VEDKPDGTLVAQHDYAYDPNGSKARDVAKKMNADDHTAYLSSTKDYTYDPDPSTVRSHGGRSWPKPPCVSRRR
jgi:hypothetical protein